ncbi:hypothetical protein CF319_g5814 [Tilletia indica]|nr:hypothetical protein CF319_g5814 [Tilletia indica]
MNHAQVHRSHPSRPASPHPQAHQVQHPILPASHHPQGHQSHATRPANHHPQEQQGQSIHAANHHPQGYQGQSNEPANHHPQGYQGQSNQPANHHPQGYQDQSSQPANHHPQGYHGQANQPANHHPQGYQGQSSQPTNRHAQAYQGHPPHAVNRHAGDHPNQSARPANHHAQQHQNDLGQPAAYRAEMNPGLPTQGMGPPPQASYIPQPQSNTANTSPATLFREHHDFDFTAWIQSAHFEAAQNPDLAHNANNPVPVNTSHPEQVNVDTETRQLAPPVSIRNVVPDIRTTADVDRELVSTASTRQRDAVTSCAPAPPAHSVVVQSVGTRRITNMPPLSPAFTSKVRIFWAIAHMLQDHPKGIPIRCFTKTVIEAHRKAPEGAYKSALWILIRRYSKRGRAQQLIVDMSVAIHFVGCMVNRPRAKKRHYGIKLESLSLCYYDALQPKRPWKNGRFAPIPSATS